LQKDVSDALVKLGYTMKVMSTFTYHTFTQQNLDCCGLFWTQPWPVGIHCIPQCQLIDEDEFGLHLNVANWKYGSSSKGLKIRKPGNYDHGTFKITWIAVGCSGPSHGRSGFTAFHNVS
jgi:hypothetical protein